MTTHTITVTFTDTDLVEALTVSTMATDGLRAWIQNTATLDAPPPREEFVRAAEIAKAILTSPAAGYLPVPVLVMLIASDPSTWTSFPRPTPSTSKPTTPE